MTAEKRLAKEQAITAVGALEWWAKRQREQDESRDGLVRQAVAAGVSKHRIHVLTGIARTTIDRILEGEPS